MNKAPLKRTMISQCVRSILFGSGTALVLSTGGTALAADSGDIDTLKDEVRVLMDRIDNLENQQATSKEDSTRQDDGFAAVNGEVEQRPGMVAASVPAPRSFKIPGSHTSVSVSGYIKADFIYDLDADVGDSFSVGAAPADSTPDQEHVRLHAKQTRLRVKSSSDLGGDKTLNTTIEGDFFGGQGTQSFSNSDHFRMRHAYMSVDTDNGSFLAGQTWTLFGGFNYVSTVDFFAPNGQTFLRQAQLRWTHPSGFAISLENPQTLLIANAASEKDEAPDIVVKWSGGPGGAAGSYSISGVARQLGGTGTGIDGNPFDDTESVFGVHVGGTWDFGSVLFTAGLAVGDGLGRYHLANTSTGAIAVNGNIVTVDQVGFTAGLKIRTSSTSSLNFNLGFSDRDNHPAMPQTNDETGTTLHANYMWSPWPETNLGIEVISGEREQYNGVDGSATRLQFGVQRHF